MDVALGKRTVLRRFKDDFNFTVPFSRLTYIVIESRVSNARIKLTPSENVLYYQRLHNDKIVTTADPLAEHTLLPVSDNEENLQKDIYDTKKSMNSTPTSTVKKAAIIRPKTPPSAMLYFSTNLSLADSSHPSWFAVNFSNLFLSSGLNDSTTARRFKDIRWLQQTLGSSVDTNDATNLYDHTELHEQSSINNMNQISLEDVSTLLSNNHSLNDTQGTVLRSEESYMPSIVHALEILSNSSLYIGDKYLNRISETSTPHILKDSKTSTNNRDFEYRTTSESNNGFFLQEAENGTLPFNAQTNPSILQGGHAENMDFRFSTKIKRLNGNLKSDPDEFMDYTATLSVNQTKTKEIYSTVISSSDIGKPSVENSTITYITTALNANFQSHETSTECFLDDGCSDKVDYDTSSVIIISVASSFAFALIAFIAISFWMLNRQRYSSCKTLSKPYCFITRPKKPNVFEEEMKSHQTDRSIYSFEHLQQPRHPLILKHEFQLKRQVVYPACLQAHHTNNVDSCAMGTDNYGFTDHSTDSNGKLPHNNTEINASVTELPKYTMRKVTSQRAASICSSDGSMFSSSQSLTKCLIHPPPY